MHNNTTFKKQYGSACLDSSDLSFKSIYAGDACSKDGSPTPSMLMGRRQNCPSPDFSFPTYLYEGDTDTACDSYLELCDHISCITLRPLKLKCCRSLIYGDGGGNGIRIATSPPSSGPFAESFPMIFETTDALRSKTRTITSQTLMNGGSK